MWLLYNETPFAAERTWTRDENGVEYWLVAIKAAFEILQDGRQVPLEEQVPVSRAPVFKGDPATTELLEESDFNFDKAKTDVLVAGHAYAPHRRPAERARFGSRSRRSTSRFTSAATGCSWTRPVAATRPRPFLKFR